MVSRDQVIGNFIPFRIFQSGKDLRTVHRFVRHCLNQEKEFEPGLEKRDVLVAYFREFDQQNYQQLRRTIRKYSIGFEAFLRITAEVIDLCQLDNAKVCVN